MWQDVSLKGLSNLAKKRIAVVPARAGSKSIPNKNVAHLNGTPLINYVLETIHRSGLFDEVVINSESIDYLKIAHEFKVEFFERSSELAQDHSDINEVLLEMFDHVKLDANWIYLFQPTSPFVSLTTIRRIVDLESKDFNLIQSITRVPHNLHAWNQRETAGTYVDFVYKKERMRAYRKQDKPTFYSFGNLLALRGSAYSKHRTIWMPQSGFTVIDRFEAIDIDTADDLLIAEFFLKSGIIQF